MLCCCSHVRAGLPGGPSQPVIIGVASLRSLEQGSPGLASLCYQGQLSSLTAELPLSRAVLLYCCRVSMACGRADEEVLGCNDINYLIWRHPEREHMVIAARAGRVTVCSLTVLTVLVLLFVGFDCNWQPCGRSLLFGDGGETD